VTVYAAGSSGNVAPAQTITGSQTALDSPDGIAVDAGGNIYVVNPGAELGPPSSVTVFGAGANGNVAPIRTISGPKTGLGAGYSDGIALDASGTIYVATSGATARVTIYAATANGNVAPIRQISGSNTGLQSPYYIAVDASSKIYVKNEIASQTGSVTVYAAGANGNVAPIQTIAGPKTGLGARSGGIAVR
jgi:secreted PhoX family phosphatase